MKHPLIAENYRLRLPGPAPVPERVSRAMTVPIVNHRGPEFRALMGEIQERLRPVLGTVNDVLLFASSGTGMMEASVLNAVAPGERVLVLNNGQFCERFAEIARTFGYNVDTVDAPWGDVPAMEDVEAALDAATYRAVIAVHNESSTGSVAELSAVGALLRERDTLFIVDSVSGLGGIEMQQDAWGIDIVASASHKALMCPPGLGLASVSEKAWPFIMRENAAARFFWDFRKARKNLETAETPFTPPVALMFGLHEALGAIHEEGLPAMLERHRRLAGALRAGGEAMGLSDFTRSRLSSNTVVVFGVPEGVEGGAIVKALYDDYRTVIAGARNRLAGKVVRFGVMGHVDFETVLTDLQQLEQVLGTLGHRVLADCGTDAARRQYTAASLSPNTAE